MKPRPPNMALQRTRRPSLRSGRSRCSLGSPLNAWSLGRMKVLLAACVMAPMIATAADKEAPFVTAKDFASPWIGYGSSGHTYRLVLKPDGSGLVASVYPFGEPEIYRVTKWSVAGRVLSIEAVSEKYPEEESLRITGKAWLSHLELDVKAKWRNGSDKWKLRLFPEETTLQNYEKLRASMRTAGAKVDR